MNLKDAFRFQNKLRDLTEEAAGILLDRRNTLKVKTIHLRSKVMADAPDALVEENPPGEYAGRATEVAAFLMALLEERETLCRAIRSAKSGLDMDMDSEVGLNRQRQRLAGIFRSMAAQKNGERMIPGGGTGFRFNGEGNQVAYRCDARQITTIDFDRDKIRNMAGELNRKSDQVSAALDQCLVNTQVEYTPPFDLNDSFDEILTELMEKGQS